MTVHIGYNMTRPSQLRTVNTLFKEGKINYVELLIDNFMNFAPEEFLKIKSPIAIHIMRSKFLEVDQGQLQVYATKIREISKLKNIIYLSDHLLKFSHKNIPLPYLQELEYDKFIKKNEITSQHIKDWSTLLGRKIYFENAASLDKRGKGQHKFFEQVVFKSGCGILMDLTNLFISIQNGGLILENWKNILQQSKIFHIGSYNLSTVDPMLHIDSHASTISSEFQDFCAEIIPMIKFDDEIYVTYERDANDDIASVTIDLSHTRKIFLGY